MQVPVSDEANSCQSEHQCMGHWIQLWGAGYGHAPTITSDPADPGLACCCCDCYGNNFNMFCTFEMLCLALFGWKAA